jgi:hypothetical protein
MMANEVRLIDAKPLMENGWHLVKTGESNKLLASMSLADVPTVDAVEVVQGRWIPQYEYDFEYGMNRLCGYNCDQCGIWTLKKSNYCPNCGTKKDGGNGDGIL